MAVPTTYSISLKVGKIEGKDLGRPQRFRSHNDRRVCQIHGVIPILFHQFERPCRRYLIQKPERQAAIKDEVAQPISADTVRRQ
jgi:hypothetical protein